MALFNYGFTHFKRHFIHKGTVIKDEKEIPHIIKEDLAYTTLIGEKVKQQVIQAGHLVLKIAKGKTLIDCQLFNPNTEKNKEKEKHTTKVHKLKAMGAATNTMLIVSFLFLLFLFALIIIRVRTARKRRARRLQKSVTSHKP
ncbi:hypothetical protein WD019_14440 [Fictibacillus sp. Mic-4]|uniref:hypothetical protein n=1 Tax=Fictibacillus sp. Mic-4 TaxID=3132826 RepID=UPI003CEA43FD